MTAPYQAFQCADGFITIGGANASPAAYAGIISGTGGLVLRYNGKFDFSTITDSCAQWKQPAGAIVEIKNKGNITIEGVNGSAANFGLAIKGGSTNVIIRNMTIGLLPGSIDAIGIEGQSGKYPGYVWVDHNTLFSSTKECSGAGDLEFDGLIDSKAGAHHITYSYNHIHDHQKVGLIGSSDSDASDRFITFHHNVYQNVKSRLPLQRGPGSGAARDSIRRAMPVDTVYTDSLGAGQLPVFGRDLFRGQTSQFLPLTHGPVGPDYQLGPGDELVLILTGDVETAYTLEVTREGFVVIPDVVTDLSRERVLVTEWVDGKRFDDVAAFDDRGHRQTVQRAAIGLGDHHVLGYVHKTTCEVTGIGSF